MTSKEFTLWLKGFITACNDYSPTPKQWDIIKEELDKVSDNIRTPIGEGGWGTPNIAPIISTPHIKPYIDPYNPFKVTCSSGSFGTEITTTPGTGYITIANPNIVSFSSGSYNPSSITYGYPSGSAWSYTTSNEKIF
jgi:hypothetical protein